MNVSRDARRTSKLAPSLPTGVVTFLFTDIEGSTQILERHRAAAGEAFARHHELLRTAVEAASGVVFETVGDAVYAAFARPLDAITAAVEMQRALAGEEWGAIGELRARIAIHSGAVEARGDHYFGSALFESARLQALAHGGQTVTSLATRSLVEPDLAEGVSLRPMGTHRLKDLATPMDVFQVEAPGLPTRFPPLRASLAAQTNLPAEMTTFVGRSGDMAAISALLEERHFLTLVGPGGTGKTRLAIEAARRHLDEYADGVWIAELAPVTDPALVIGAVADVWGLRAGEGSSLDEVLARFLSSRRLLLVIDNCEHVLDEASSLVARIQQAAPHVSVVATSREPLQLPGETVYRVPSLSVDADDPGASEAVSMFLDRAQAVRPGFSPSREDLEAIGRISRRLDGMPLGLELAAARLRTLSPGDLADRLDESFRILTGGARTALPRQRTLQATIDWSHEMLSDAERAVFRRLSTFAGGFDVAAAEAVGAGDPVDEAEVLDHLDSLVAKSLVLAIHGPSSRFRMLEPIREYAQEALEASGEAAASRLAHAHHFAAFVAEAGPHTRGPDQMAWERRIARDYDNVRVAFTTLRQGGELDRYLDMGFELFLFWMHVGRHLEGIETLVSGLAAAPADTDRLRLVKAWAIAAGLGAEITRPESIEHARRGLEIARSMGDPNAIGRMELQLGASIRHATTDPEYLGHLHEARRLLEQHPEPHWWEPEWEHGFLNLVLAAYLPADDERVLEHVHAAIEAFERVGDEALLAATLADSTGLWGQVEDGWILANLDRAIEILGRIEAPYWYGHALYTQGILHNMMGNHDAAADVLARGAGHLEDSGDVSCWAGASRGLADSESRLGAAEPARRRVAEVIRRLPALPMQEVARPRTLDAAAAVLVRGGSPREGAVVLGWCETIELPVPTLIPRRERLLELHDLAVAEIGAEEAERLFARGATMAPDDLLRQALAWLEPVAAE